MSEEGADLVSRSWRQDVLKLAGLLLDFGLTIHGETVREEPLGETVPANDAAGLLASSRREGHHRAAVGDENSSRTHGVVTRIHERLVAVGFRRMRAGREQ